MDCVLHTTNYQTIKMPCSLCQQSGHNKRTCSLVKQVATTGKYAGLNAIQIEAIFAERMRRDYEEIVAPIIAPKLACFACGQVETECHLEIIEQGMTLCCDCLYIENHPDATCHRCDKKLYSKTLVLCGGGGGECETWYCATCHADGTHDCPVCGDDDDEGMEDCEYCGYTHHYEDKCPNEATAHHYEKWRVDEEDDDETVSVESEDTCECCGRPYDHRNPHRQSEMCDCVQNDDGTLSRPEDDLELPCPDCRRWFDEGKDNCKSCDFDLNSFNKPPSPTHDQLIALGKYKLAKFQIGKSDN